MPHLATKLPPLELNLPSLSPTRIGIEVRRGLSRRVKYLPTKLLYDARGSEIYEQIMALEEYYPNRTEASIMAERADQIAGLMPDGPFMLIDLGSGDGTKTECILEALESRFDELVFVPVDISRAALEGQAIRLQARWPHLQVQPLTADYLTAMAHLKIHMAGTAAFGLILGGNIGNFPTAESLALLRQLWHLFTYGDRLMIGFDLKKDPSRILAAYNDREGVTAEFNLNLLDRLNRELGANFHRDQFVHAPTYDPAEGVAKSFLVSRRRQVIHFEALEWQCTLDAWEAIHTENSHKYSPMQIEEMSGMAGYRILAHLTDSERLFTDSVWEVIK